MASCIVYVQPVLIHRPAEYFYTGFFQRKTELNLAETHCFEENHLKSASKKSEYVIDQTGVKCYYDRHGKKHIIKKNAENESKNVEAVQICNRTSQNPINVRKTLDSPIPVNLKTVYAYNLIQNTTEIRFNGCSRHKCSARLFGRVCRNNEKGNIQICGTNYSDS